MPDRIEYLIPGVLFGILCIWIWISRTTDTDEQPLAIGEKLAVKLGCVLVKADITSVTVRSHNITDYLLRWSVKHGRGEPGALHNSTLGSDVAGSFVTRTHRIDEPFLLEDIHTKKHVCQLWGEICAPDIRLRLSLKRKTEAALEPQST